MERRISLVNHTNEIIINLDLLVSNMKDAETGVRGFVIMKDEDFLQPYYQTEQKSDSIYSALRKVLNSDPFQTKRLDTINLLIKEKFVIINTAIYNVRHNSFSVKVLPDNGYRGFFVMNELRRIVSIMQTAEKQTLVKRTDTLNYTVTFFKIIIFVTLIISIVLAAYSFITFNKENRAKRLYRNELEKGIESLKKMNQELVELKSVEKFLVSGRISRTIAHEVRNPLTNISLAAEQLVECVPKTEDTELLIGMIKRNSNRINELVSDLLNSTKFSQLDLESVSINTVLNKALEYANDRIELYNIRVIKKYSLQPCIVYVDPKLIHIAFLNIIVNAIEATEPGKGQIEVKTECLANRCVITIRDNGKGMDKESLSRIFEPYFTSKNNGNGLGLTNTQNIILNHKGNISIDSKLGEGSIFTIVLFYKNSITSGFNIDESLSVLNSETD